MLDQFVSGTATDMSYLERSSFLNCLTFESIWSFELAEPSGIDVAFHVKVGFRQSDKSTQQR